MVKVVVMTPAGSLETMDRGRLNSLDQIPTSCVSGVILA